MGIANGTNEELHNVFIQLSPAGTHSGGWLNSKNPAWYMAITHWPAPEKITITFCDDKGKNYTLETKTGLKRNFSGDILAIIKKNMDGDFHLEIKIGKLNEL